MYSFLTNLPFQNVGLRQMSGLAVRIFFRTYLTMSPHCANCYISISFLEISMKWQDVHLRYCESGIDLSAIDFCLVACLWLLLILRKSHLCLRSVTTNLRKLEDISTIFYV